jgi:hypothetical protein
MVGLGWISRDFCEFIGVLTTNGHELTLIIFYRGPACVSLRRGWWTQMNADKKEVEGAFWRFTGIENSYILEGKTAKRMNPKETRFVPRKSTVNRHE